MNNSACENGTCKASNPVRTGGCVSVQLWGTMMIKLMGNVLIVLISVMIVRGLLIIVVGVPIILEMLIANVWEIFGKRGCLNVKRDVLMASTI